MLGVRKSKSTTKSIRKDKEYREFDNRISWANRVLNGYNKPGIPEYISFHIEAIVDGLTSKNSMIRRRSISSVSHRLLRPGSKQDTIYAHEILNRTIERGDKEGLEVVRDICIRGIGHFSNEATTLASLSKLVRQNGKADTTTRRLVTQKT